MFAPPVSVLRYEMEKKIGAAWEAKATQQANPIIQGDKPRLRNMDQINKA
jgi:hypothetical protein